MKRIFEKTSEFEAFEDIIARTITSRLGIEPSIDQLTAWEYRERADTFLRPDITDNNFSVELSSTMSRIAIKSLKDPLIEFKEYKDNGWNLKDQRAGLTRSTAEDLSARNLLLGYSCTVSFTSFNYPSNTTEAIIWYAPASRRRTADATEQFISPDSGNPHVNRISTKPRFTAGLRPNIEVVRESRKNSGALQRQRSVR